MTNITQLPRRKGMTLVELLVVIVIIIILAGLLIPAVMGVIEMVNQTSIGAEIMQLDAAIETYRTDTGEYPPDFSSLPALQGHLARCYPNHQEPTGSGAAGLTGMVTAIGPDEVLHKILSEMHNEAFFPFSGTSSKIVRFTFKEERLKDLDGDGYPSYMSASGVAMPYLYYDMDPSRSLTPEAYNGFTPSAVSSKKFQIISAGLDGDFGTGAVAYPTGPYSSAQQDNVTNFTGGKTLEDAKQQP